MKYRLKEDIFDNEKTLKYFRKLSLDEFKDAIEVWIFRTWEEVYEILTEDISISCYWSDSRFDKTNNSTSSLDLLVCNNNLDLSISDITAAVRFLVSQNIDCVYDNSYPEFNDDWTYEIIKDEIEVWKKLDILQIDDEYIDVLNKSEDLYKYKGKYFPDRLLDSYFIWWNQDILKSFKIRMLDDFINDNKILSKYKKWIKKYYNEEYISWKNHRSDLDNTFELTDKWWLIRFDWEQYFWFKHGPLRSLQYKIVELFLKLVIEKSDSSLVEMFPFDIEWRLAFLLEHNAIVLRKEELIELLDIYTFFKDINTKLEALFNTNIKSGINNIQNTETEWVYKLLWDDFHLKLNRYIEIFNKLKKE